MLISWHNNDFSPMRQVRVSIARKHAFLQEQFSLSINNAIYLSVAVSKHALYGDLRIVKTSIIE